MGMMKELSTAIQDTCNACGGKPTCCCDECMIHLRVRDKIVEVKPRTREIIRVVVK
jgi:hypothetical protein